MEKLFKTKTQSLFNQKNKNIIILDVEDPDGINNKARWDQFQGVRRRNIQKHM